MSGTGLRWTLSSALLAVFIAFLVVGGGGGAPGTYTAPTRLVTVLATALALIAFAIVATRDPRWRPASAIWPALVAVVVAFSLSTLTSWNPRLGLEMTSQVVLLIGLYLLLRQLFRSSFFEPRILVLTAGLSAIVGIAFLVSVFTGWIDWWSLSGGLSIPPLRPGYGGLTYGSPNAVAAVVVLFMAPAVAFLSSGSRRRRAIAASLVVLAALVTFLSGSRGAWLGFAAASALTLLLLVNRTRATRLREAVVRRPRLAIAIAAPIVLGALVFMPAVLSRALGGGGESLRQTLTAVSVRMFATAPLTGSGPGTWAARRASFTEPGETDYYIPHAHNVYAQILAEFGIVGIAATVVVVACLAWLVWSGLRRPGPVKRPMAIAAVFGLVFLGFQQLVDSHMNLLSVLFGAAIPIAWLDAKSPTSVALPFGFDSASLSARIRPPRLVLPAAGVLAFIAMLGATSFLVWSNVKALDSQRIAELFRKEDWPAAYQLASRLAADDSGITAYHFVLGLSAARVGEIAEASRELELAAKKDDFPQGWLNVAALRLESGDLKGSRDAIDRALRLGRQDVAIVFPSGVMLLKLGDDAEAVRAFVGALALTPSLASDPYWGQPSVSALTTQIFDQAIAQSGAGSAFEIALLTNRIDQANEAAARQDRAQHAFLDQVLRAWNGADNAYQAIRAQAAANPNDTQALAWSARLAHRAGDFALSERYRRQLDLMNVFTAIGNGMDIRVAPNGGMSYTGGQPQPGLNNGWSYGVFTYLRQIPVDILVPGVPHLVLQ